MRVSLVKNTSTFQLKFSESPSYWASGQRKQEDQRHVQRGKATCCPYHLLDWFAEYTSAPETLHPKTSAETAHRCGGCVEKIVESQRRFQLPHKRPMHSLYPQCLCALPKYGWDDVSSNIGRCHVHVTVPLFGSSPEVLLGNLRPDPSHFGLSDPGFYNAHPAVLAHVAWRQTLLGHKQIL